MMREEPQEMPLFPLPPSATRSAAEDPRATPSCSLWPPCVTSDDWYQPCLYSPCGYVMEGAERLASRCLSRTPPGRQTAQG